MADQGRSDFYVVFTMSSLCTWIKTIVNKLAISNHSALILGVHALRSYLKLSCEYELYILPNKKVSPAKDHGKTSSRSDGPLVAIFCVIVYSDTFFEARCIVVTGVVTCLLITYHQREQDRTKSVNMQVDCKCLLHRIQPVHL